MVLLKLDCSEKIVLNYVVYSLKNLSIRQGEYLYIIQKLLRNILSILIMVMAAEAGVA